MSTGDKRRWRLTTTISEKAILHDEQTIFVYVQNVALKKKAKKK